MLILPIFPRMSFFNILELILICFSVCVCVNILLYVFDFFYFVWCEVDNESLKVSEFFCFFIYSLKQIFVFILMIYTVIV